MSLGCRTFSDLPNSRQTPGSKGGDPCGIVPSCLELYRPQGRSHFGTPSAIAFVSGRNESGASRTRTDELCARQDLAASGVGVNRVSGSEFSAE